MKSLLTASSLVLGAVLFSILARADVAPPPEISSFSPTQGIIGTAVTIQGKNFTGTTSVQFNGAEAVFSVLADLITAIVPTNATTGPITIRTPGGTLTSTDTFTVPKQDPPTDIRFTPAEGVPGTPVEIQGLNLTNVISVRFNGVEASFSVVTGLLVSSVPAAAVTGPISVTTAGGTAASTNSFTVLRNAPPAITGFVPASGPPGSVVEIQGANLANVTAVQFNGVTAAFLSFGGTLRATVPLTAATGPITVTTPAGSSTSSQSFTVTPGPPPTISDFSPKSGDFGAEVEIRGTFLRDVLSVKFNGLEAVFTNSLFRPLSATVPTNATTGPITVVTRSGTATSADVFTVVNPRAPIVNRFTPLSGRARELIQIYGTNLAGLASVEFNGTAAEFLEFGNERFFAFVPESATSGPIKVSTRNGMAVSQETFIVLGATPEPEAPALQIQAIAPTRVEISWKLSAGYRVEITDSLSPPVRWAPAGLTPLEEQGRSSIVVDLDAKSRFYRLGKP